MDISTPTLRELLAFLGGLVIAIPSWVSVYRSYKKSRIEDEEAEARTQLARESVHSVRIRDSIAAGEGVGKMLASLIETGETLGELQQKIFDLEQDRIELKMVRKDVKQLKGLLDAHGISYSEKDGARTKDRDEGKGNGNGVVRD